jgi:hypothetical protein
LDFDAWRTSGRPSYLSEELQLADFPIPVMPVPAQRKYTLFSKDAQGDVQSPTPAQTTAASEALGQSPLAINLKLIEFRNEVPH